MTRGFFTSLINATDPAVDSIIIAGLMAMTALCGVQAFDVFWNHTPFSPLGFGSGAGAILAAIGAGKLMRDGVTAANPAPPMIDK